MKGLQAALENAPSALAARSVLEGFDVAIRYHTTYKRIACYTVFQCPNYRLVWTGCLLADDLVQNLFQWHINWILPVGHCQ